MVGILTKTRKRLSRWAYAKRKSSDSELEETCRRLAVDSLEDRNSPAIGAPFLLSGVVAPNGFFEPGSFADFGEKAIFSAVGNDSAGNNVGREIWITDGTIQGTTLLKDIVPGPEGSGIHPYFTRAGRFMFFWAEESFQQFQVWRTDGTTAGTFRVSNLVQSGSFGFRHAGRFVAIGESVVFTFDDSYYSSTESGVFRAGSDPNSTTKLLARYYTHFYFDDVVKFGSSAYFFASIGGYGPAIWRTDGTVAGTTIAINGDADLKGANDQFLYGTTQNPVANGILWLSDGTPLGTRTINVGQTAIDSFYTYQQKLYFLGTEGNLAYKWALWSCDGTVAGTTRFALLDRPLGDEHPTPFVGVGSKLLFGYKTAAEGFELWQSDFTQAGTKLLRDTYPGPVSGLSGSQLGSRPDEDIDPGFSYDGNTYFSAINPQSGIGNGIWQSDGSFEGTKVAFDVSDSPDFADLHNCFRFKNLILYEGIDRQMHAIPLFPTGSVHRADLLARWSETGQWYLAASTGGSFATSLVGTWSPGVTWADVQTGDFNGDGRDDVVGRWKEAGQWFIGLSTDTGLATALWSTWSANVTWSDVHVGDFNGDGRDDIVGRYEQAGQWYVGLSTGSGFATSLWATWSSSVRWTDVAVGDFNNDGKSDIVGRWKEAGHWYVGLAQGGTFATSYWGAWSNNVEWVDVAVGDFNGDLRTDIVGRWRQTGQWYLAQSGGYFFVHKYWGAWSPEVDWVDVVVGDFNADGKTDLCGRWKETGQWYVGRSTGTSMRNSLFAVWTASIAWRDVVVGDFDGDGKDDIAARWQETGHWYVGRSTSLRFETSLWAVWTPGLTWVDVRDLSEI